jgi:hypothetical protein
MTKKKQTETYIITMKGLIASCPGIVEFQVDQIWDTIELYGRRNMLNAILLENGGIFIDVELPKEK